MIFIVFAFLSLHTLSFGDQLVTDDGFDERFPEENPGLFEGDIELTGVNPFKRNAIGNKEQLWPDGVVPYELYKYFNSRTNHTILSAMKEIDQKTGNCIHFVPKRSHHRYSIRFASGRGCSSRVGFTGAHQKITLGRGCRIKGIVIHEILHSLGFFHEQNRPDRDDYVKIILNNIRKGKARNFKKYSSPIIDDQGFPYDYNSIMHYGRYSFAIDRRMPTIEPVKSNAKIGQRKRLSPIDIKEIRKLYGCNELKQLAE